MRPLDAEPGQTFHVEETGPVAQATSRFKKILDAKYKKADLD